MELELNLKQPTNNYKAYSLSFLGAMGVITAFYSIRKHYLRLKNRNTKKIAASDSKSETNNSSSIKIEEENTITEDLVEKMLEKIKNNTIHSICICIDRFGEKRQPNPQNSSTPQIEENKEKDDDIVVEDSSLVKSELLDSKLKENNIEKEYDDFLPDFERGLFAYNAFRQGQNVMTCKF